MHVIGSKLHGRDLLIGFDLYHKAQRLQVLPTGLKYKRYFQPFSTIPRIFAIADAPAPYTDIANQLKQCCADSHADFKHPHPLWKNPEFFIQLPFKLNEDANPIKASHPGMTPDDLALAREECSQLLALGLIEPTKSNWACPAFYVNKRTEQIRGKKRLVIDYKALNHFLLDEIPSS
ncbi:UNVERIFIED_CONTAM: polyprotein [Sesamum radiatum]|uniref:Polyprotein n=1 Tax=Sesamum radiatum TaxID=300843 RepID=A0AAW2J4K9_SESRA